MDDRTYYSQNDSGPDGWLLTVREATTITPYVVFEARRGMTIAYCALDPEQVADLMTRLDKWLREHPWDAPITPRKWV